MKHLTKTCLRVTALVDVVLALGCGEGDGPGEGGTGDPPPDGPNIVLIVVDDIGYADFGPFGGDATLAPRLTQLAESGRVFAEAYVAAPVCSPSRAGLLTGKLPSRWDPSSGWGPGLPAGVKTVAEYLQEHGYATARFGKSDFGSTYHRYDVREYPLNHGYDEFLGFSAHGHDYFLLSEAIRDRTPDPYGTSAVLGPLMHNTGEKSFEEGYLTEILTDEAVAYMARTKGRPFFLTVAYNAVHHLIHESPVRYLEEQGLVPIPSYDPDAMVAYGGNTPGTYLAYYDKYSRVEAIPDGEMRRYYLANLRCLDDNIGRLLDGLAQEGLEENTIVLFLSDNGGSPLTGASNAPLTAGKYSLYEGGIRVPMAIRWPGRTAPGEVEHRVVSALDILPTLTEAVGIPVADDTLDGVSLLFPEPERLLVWRWEDTWAVRRGDWKLTNAHENHWKGAPSSQYIWPVDVGSSLKLFNLSDDPGERTDLAETYPEKVAELQVAYQTWCDANLGRY